MTKWVLSKFGLTFENQSNSPYLQNKEEWLYGKFSKCIKVYIHS